MRVFKNLFGDGSKIHTDEVVVGLQGDYKTLTEKLSEPVYPADALKTLRSIGAFNINANGAIQSGPSRPSHINDITETGLYYLEGGVSGKPTSHNMYFIIICANNGHTVQIGTSTNVSDGSLYMRKGTMSGGTMSWGAWLSVEFQ